MMTNRGPGERLRKQRYRTRKLAEHHTAMDALRTKGASCATCTGFAKAPHGLQGHVCEPESDFHGYAMTTADRLCIKYSSEDPSS